MKEKILERDVDNENSEYIPGEMDPLLGDEYSTNNNENFMNGSMFANFCVFVGFAVFAFTVNYVIKAVTSEDDLG